MPELDNWLYQTERLYRLQYYIFITCILTVKLSALDQWFAASNPADNDEVLRGIQIHSTFFLEDVKPSAPCRKILWHFKQTCGA
jgi:hypothetical protein